MVGRRSFVPMHPGTFCEGMHLEGEVYFKRGSGYTFLCKDAVLTPELFSEFYAAGWEGQELYIEEQYLDKMLEMSKHLKLAQRAKAVPGAVDKAKIVKLQNDYKDLKQRLGSIMDDIQTSGMVPLETYEILAGEVHAQLDLTDAAILLDFINNMRDPDDYLNAHTANVGMLNGMMGAWLRLPQDDIDALIKVGFFHDLGKLRVPIEILHKPGPLDDKEFYEMKKHPAYAYEILRLSGETDQRILEGVLSHHERLNGTGYPSGLSLPQISLFARVTAISDVYDAMVAKRVYKDRHSPFKILADFAHNRFSNLDIAMVNVFLDRLPAVLLGKNVLLSDGRSAKVFYINPFDFAHPIVELNGELISTGGGLECVAMEDFLVSDEH